MLLVFSMHTAAFAESTGRFDQGKMSVGFGAGGGKGFFNVAASYGYFVIDRLRPEISLSYHYQNMDPGKVHEVRSNLGLRYYILDSDPISPFLVVEGGHIHLVQTDIFEGEYDFFSVAGGAGLNLRITGNFGLELVAGAIRYIGVDKILHQRKTVPEGVNFWWNLGFSVVF